MQRILLYMAYIIVFPHLILLSQQHYIRTYMCTMINGIREQLQEMYAVKKKQKLKCHIDNLT